MADLWKRDGATLNLHFHRGQTRAWKSERRFVFVLAGTQGGKTSWGPFWLHREIQRCGGGDYLAVTANYDLFQLKMLPALLETFEHLLGIGRYHVADRVIELKNPETGKFIARRNTPMWGRIILRSAEAKSGLESATAKAAWLDECGQDSFTVETWEAVLRRLSIYQGRVLGTTTPYAENWLKREIVDRWQAGDPNYDVIRFHSSQNPSFPKEEQERARDTMPAWRYRMFYEGEFARPAGLIYDCFDDAIHLIEPFAIPANWPRYSGVDFGGANTAVLWLAERPGTGSYVLYEESLTGGKTTREHVEEAQQIARETNMVAAWGGAKSEGQARADWLDNGFELKEPPISDVEVGIGRVYALFKERRLQVFRTCKGTLDQLGGYRRKIDQNGEPTAEIENKRAYHYLDGLRYVVAGLTGVDDAPVGVISFASARGW